MAGILDPKTRVMDFILTELGREQAAQGELSVKFATLSDRAAFYSSGSAKGVADEASDRIYFEAASSPHDLIVVESDFEGKIKAFRTDDFVLQGGNIVKANPLPGESEVVRGKSVVQNSRKILSSITGSFRNIQHIKTIDIFNENRGFEVNPDALFYEFNDIESGGVDLPPHNSKATGFVDQMPSLFQDRKMSHLPNFRFLPPRNFPDPTEEQGEILGDYPKFKDDFEENQDPMGAHMEVDQMGFEKREIFFNQRTTENNVLMQPFEFTNEGITKLSSIDGGTYRDPDTRALRHVFYVGKLVADTKQTTVFVKIFTVVFKENLE